MVEAAHDGQANGEADGPAGEDDDVGGGCVLPVLAVHDGGRHSKISEVKEYVKHTQNIFHNKIPFRHF